MPAKKSSRKQSTKKRSSTRRKTAQSTPRLEIPPHLQREIFAVLLVFLGLLTLLFSTVGGDQGALGTGWNGIVEKAFGTGKVLVPVALGILGALMIYQERLKDARLTGANIIGTFLVLLALLVLLDYPGFEERHQFRAFHVGEGGGVVGGMILAVLIALIGKHGALLLSITVGLIGVMLAFNLTLHQIWATLLFYSAAVRRGLQSLVGTPPDMSFTEQHDTQLLDPQPLPESRSSRRRKADPELPAPEPEEVMLTPIAERPAIARLFHRGNGSEQQPKERKRRGRKSEPLPEASAAQLALSDAPTTPIPAKSIPPKPAPVDADDDILEPDEQAQRAWPLPTLSMLDDFVEGQIGDEEKREKARIIEETLASFKVEARVVEANTGPAVTQFALQPAIGVKISKITSLSNDLALALAAPSLRIEAPVPGRSVVGIEIPNSAIALVAMRDVMESDEFNAKRMKLKIPLGKDVSGSSVVADLTKMPHLLVAGSTGSGKSICINAIILSLLMKHTPNELKFIMVDPKMVELIVYNSIPHLLTPVVTELERVVSALKWAVREMERRYKVFAKGGYRNLDSYMRAARKNPEMEPLPYIVVIIDELADLMMLAPDEVETLICRLAQMARATGIHLIIATQRPSVDVVTGLIKANFPSRIAFAVTSQIDSRVILDTPGAEQLLGRGDMLYLAADAAKSVRIQGTFVSDGEVERIVTFWRSQSPPDPHAPAVEKPKQTQTSMGDVFLQTEEKDELLPKAIELVQQHQRASASMLQRRLRIGYSKAAQLIDLLEQEGIVGPAEGGRSREVIKQK